MDKKWYESLTIQMALAVVAVCIFGYFNWKYKIGVPLELLVGLVGILRTLQEIGMRRAVTRQNGGTS